MKVPALTFCLAWLTLSGTALYGQTIKYVKPVASGTGDGSSWANASANLKAIIDGATANTQIWVATGTYKPTTGTDRTISFVMKNSVAIFGGFTGTETQLAQRNWNSNETILSGDIGAAGNSTDNSYHVIFNNNNNLNSTAILDGFTVRDGRSVPDNAFPFGGAIYNKLTSPAIANCKFVNNNASSGGAIFQEGNNLLGVLNISNCSFVSNSSVYNGGALYLYNQLTTNSITQCAFINNNSSYSGGGVYAQGSYTTLRNCAFTGNTSLNQGGGIYTNQIGLIENCSFSGNVAPTDMGGAIYSSGNTIKIVNSILWANSSGIKLNTFTLATVSYSIIQGGYSGTGNLNVDPQFVSQSDLRLQLCSPAQDAGDDEFNTDTDTDLAGNPRKFDGKPGSILIDMGAYELQAVCPTLFVKANAAGTNNGGSWSNAFTNLQDALELARQFQSITQIWVAAGTYKPTTGTDRAVSFVMKNNLAIYGGFAGIETQLAQRNWNTNETTLSGDIGAAGNSADNSYNVISNNNNALNNTAILDGFTITAGNANGPSRYSQGGGGISNNLSSPLISHCNFIDNKANFGGALDVIGSGTRVTECRFSGNTATIQGGAININSASVPIFNSSFFGNTTGNGGALYFDGQAGGAVKLTNCSVSGNAATLAGGAVFINQGTSFIENSIIWGNSSNIAIGPLGTLPSVSYSIVQGGSAGTGNLDTDPQFVQQPPVGLGTTGNLSLLPCSPAINTGLNSYNTTTQDLAGTPRKFGNIDMGAYERQSAKPTTWYLDSAATGTGDGSSWANAFTSLGTALSQLKNCSTTDTLFIAKGTYNAGAPFEMDKLQGVILGGYPTGGGTRNATANPVVVKGVVNVRKSMKIEGLIMQSP